MGLIQREIESRGIRTAAMIHLPDLFKKSRPPRALISPFPLGHAFSEKAGQHEMQRDSVYKLLKLAQNGGSEEYINWEPYK